MKDVLLFDQAGPVAILVLVLLMLAKLTHWLLMKLISDKDKQIEQLSGAVEALTVEIGETLNTILVSVQQQAEAVKQQAEERRRAR